MASTSTDPLTEDYCCAFCLQRLPYMVDPRQLPCSHVFCLSCLKADFAEISATRCRICTKTHEIDDSDTLPVADNATSGEDKSAKLLTKVLCDVCTGHRSISITCCCDCKKHYCEEHHQMHDGFMGPGHTFISSKPCEFTNSTCEEHIEEPLTLACSVCHKTFCTSCDTESGCEDKGVSHSIVKLEELAKLFRKEMKEALKTFSEKITEASKTEKCAWNILDDAETKVEKMKREVARVAEAEILRIQEISKATNEDLDRYLRETTSETHGFSADLLSKIGNSQDLWRPLSQMMKGGDLELVQTYKKSMKLLQKETSSPMTSRKRKYPESTLNSIDMIKELKSPVINHSLCPASVELLKRCSETYHCVSWTNEGNLVAGGTTLTIFTRKLDKLKCCDVPSGAVTSAAQIDLKPQYLVPGVRKYVAFACKQADGYSVRFLTAMLAVEEGGLSSPFQNVEVTKNCYPQLTINYHTSQIFVMSFKCHPSTTAFVGLTKPHWATSSMPVDVEEWHLAVFSFSGDLEFNASVKDGYGISLPTGIHCLSNGTVLISYLKANVVRKYFIDPAVKKLIDIWTSDRVNSPTGISSDSAGHIYVGRGSSGTIYILSCFGNLLTTIDLNSYNITRVRDVDVSGTQMAVACDEDGLFMFDLIRGKSEAKSLNIM